MRRDVTSGRRIVPAEVDDTGSGSDQKRERHLGATCWLNIATGSTAMVAHDNVDYRTASASFETEMEDTDPMTRTISFNRRDGPPSSA